MMFLDIIFQFGKSISYGGNSEVSNWDWFLKYFLTPFLSFGAALFLYYLKERRDKKKDIDSKKKSSDNDVKYFYTVINEVLKDLPRQIEQYKDYSEAVRKEPQNTHSLTVVMSENLIRIVSKYDQQKMFHSYIAQFKKEHVDEAIQRFMDLYKSLDIYMKLYNDVITINTRLNEEVDKRLNIDYNEIIRSRFGPNFDKLFDEIKTTSLPLRVVLENIKSDYDKRKDPTPIIVQEVLINQLLPHFGLLKAHTLGLEVYNDCRILTSIYLNVVNNSIHKSTEVARLAGQLETTKNKIETIMYINKSLAEYTS